MDYTDLVSEYFAINWQIDGSGSAVVRGEFEPLAERGGLRSNQYAELVHSKLVAGMTGDQGNTSNFNAEGTEMRGVLGVDISPNDDITGTQPQFNGNVGDFSFPTSNQPADPDLSTKLDTDIAPEVFDWFRMVNAQEHTTERHYRSLYGRGPVLDPEDEMNVYTTSVHDGTSGSDQDVTVIVECTWDLAEGDDAREQFSLPE